MKINKLVKCLTKNVKGRHLALLVVRRIYISRNEIWILNFVVHWFWFNVPLKSLYPLPTVITYHNSHSTHFNDLIKPRDLKFYWKDTFLPPITCKRNTNFTFSTQVYEAEKRKLSLNFPHSLTTFHQNYLHTHHKRFLLIKKQLHHSVELETWQVIFRNIQFRINKDKPVTLRPRSRAVNRIVAHLVRLPIHSYVDHLLPLPEGELFLQHGYNRT